jgi:hypothetical protein
MLRFGSCSKVARFALVPILMFWMAGGACIFGCESAHAAVDNHSSAAPAQGTQHRGESCAAHETQDCCAGTGKTNQRVPELKQILPDDVLALTEAPSESVRRCPMGLNLNAAVSQVRIPDATVTHIQPFLESAETGVQLIRVSDQLPVLNRGGTHLRCCVFLI